MKKKHWIDKIYKTNEDILIHLYLTGAMVLCAIVTIYFMIEAIPK